MNQNRVSWMYSISVAVYFFIWGALWDRWNTQRDNLPLFLLSLLLLFLGIQRLHRLTYEANAWQFNVTPHNLKLAPQGSWAVICAGTYRHNHQDDAVYVTVAKTPACDRALSALRLQSEWLDIRDYTRIVNGDQPRGISIGDRVTFTWE